MSDVERPGMTVETNVIHGDCLEVMPTLDAESIDAIVTDPPYGLEFMGKEWDRLVAPARGRTAGIEHEATLEHRNDTPQHRAGVRQPARLLRCAICGGNSSGEWNRCRCDKPDFRARTDLALRMQEWHHRWAVEALRVAKPGAYLLTFGGTRTYHRLACAIEDAGWEIRDCLVWAYASGFPKSLDVSKAIDKAAGAEREVKPWLAPMKSGAVATGGGMTGNKQCPLCGKWLRSPDPCKCPKDDGPATPEAARWQGWGTALKPAWEPIILARKPLRGTVAANVLATGCGALNIGATRIGAPTGVRATSPDASGGRWPPNLLLTSPIFDGDMPGVVGGGETGPMPGNYRHAEGEWDLTSYRGTPPGAMQYGFGDSGTYSRFFLIPKASRADREPVLGGLPSGDRAYGASKGMKTRECRVCGDRTKPAGPHPTNWPACGHSDWEWRDALPLARANAHPTVKPLDLMRHLVRLVTPPGGLVLDPFLGSGTTALAAEMEGFRWIGIEREEEYVRIAEARLNGTQRGLGIA